MLEDQNKKKILMNTESSYQDNNYIRTHFVLLTTIFPETIRSMA